MTVTVGALFAGTGALELGVEAALGEDVDVRWVSEVDPAAAKVLAHRRPGVANLGDVTTVDWSTVEPVDVVTGGFPCQDVSTAGKRRGLRPDTRSGLWSQMAYAIDRLRPRLVVVENVRGLLSAAAHSDVEPCPWCLGDAEDEPAMRALGAVQGDLADLGFDAEWCGLLAADVGAPHGRFRVFLTAYPSGQPWRVVDGGDEGARGDQNGRGPAAGPHVALMPTPTTNRGRAGRRAMTGIRQWSAPGLEQALEIARGELPREFESWDEVPGRSARLPTPRARDSDEDPDTFLPRTAALQDGDRGGGQTGMPLGVAVQLLPTPAAQMSASNSAVHWEGEALYRDADGSKVSTHLTTTIQHLHTHPSLLPTPTSQLEHDSQTHRSGPRSDELLLTGAVAQASDSRSWGAYGPAVRRWEHVSGVPAPDPTQVSDAYMKSLRQRQAGTHPAPVGMRGSLKPRRVLSPVFVEWMQGLPPGWVTQAPGISRADMLRVLGNGVLPAQAAAAVRHLLTRTLATTG